MKKKRVGMVGKFTASALLLGTLLAPVGTYVTKAEAAGGSPSVKLRIMETTDLHSNVMDYDYYKDAPVKNFGLARTAVLIEQARAQVDPDNSMLFDAGDLIQGNPMADYVAKIQKLGPNDTHPIFKAMELLNYDAGIVGNHEFNYGLDYLNTVLTKVPYKNGIVNANIYKDDHDGNPANDQNYFTPYQIINKTVKDSDGAPKTIKVGVIGFAPPQIMQWDKDNLQGKVIAKDIVETAKSFIPKMKADGADIIVAIAHSGCDISQENQQDAENAVYALSKVPGIDVMLFGHAHVNFPGDASFTGKTGIDNVKGTINSIPALEAGYWGNNLGVMDLELQQENGKWKVATVDKVENRPVTAVTEADQTIVKAVQAEHEGTLSYVRGKIGTTTAPMYSYFARIQDDPTIQIVNNAQTDYVKKWIAAKSPELKDEPVLSAGAPFKAGRQGPADYTNILAGDLSIKSANDLYLYPNTLKAVELTGAQVKDWLEMSAAQFKQIDPLKSETQELIDYNFQPFNFDVIDGVKYEIDVTKPAKYDLNGKLINPDTSRIVNFTMPDGTPVNLNQKFIVATNNYRAGGGGNFPGLIGGKAKIVVDSPDESRQVLMDYIIAKGTINPSADMNWKIASVNKTVKVKFQSSPGEDAQKFAALTTNIKFLGTFADANNQQWGSYSLDLAPVEVVATPVVAPANPTASPTPVANSAVSSHTLPNTATSMFNFVFFGLLLVGAGVTLVVRRKRME